jgi:AcrR family transcriptional regulator
MARDKTHPQPKPPTRERVLDAAERLLAQGSAGFSMRELADEAGVSFATPFNQFGSKAAIMLALSARCDRRAERGRERCFVALQRFMGRGTWNGRGACCHDAGFGARGTPRSTRRGVSRCAVILDRGRNPRRVAGIARPHWRCHYSPWVCRPCRAHQAPAASKAVTLLPLSVSLAIGTVPREAARRRQACGI